MAEEGAMQPFPVTRYAPRPYVFSPLARLL